MLFLKKRVFSKFDPQIHKYASNELKVDIGIPVYISRTCVKFDGGAMNKTDVMLVSVRGLFFLAHPVYKIYHYCNLVRKNIHNIHIIFQQWPFIYQRESLSQKRNLI